MILTLLTYAWRVVFAAIIAGVGFGAVWAVLEYRDRQRAHQQQRARLARIDDYVIRDVMRRKP